MNALSDTEFARFQALILRVAGISLTPAKKGLVAGRLAKRLVHYGIESYGEYFRLVTNGARADEMQVMVDVLTTHETYFFREPHHFSFLKEEILPLWRGCNRSFRVWSAACSSGEEPYSIAMMLSDDLGGTVPWDVVASDISTGVLDDARTGRYSMERAEEIPKRYLSVYCLKGVRSQSGTLLIDKQLRNRVRFVQVNLTAPLPDLGVFDLIFLRNVLIYFDMATKRQVVLRVLSLLKAGGYLFLGHAETLNGITGELILQRPTVYRKP